MPSLRLWVWGVLLVVIDVRIDGLDVAPDPLGWVLVVAGTAPLARVHAGFAWSSGAAALGALTSVLGALDVVDDGSAQLVSTVLEVTAVFATCTALAATLPSPEERRSARRLGWWGLALGLTSPVLAALAATDELGIVVLAVLLALVAAIVVLVRTLLLVRHSAAQPPPAETALSPLPG